MPNGFDMKWEEFKFDLPKFVKEFEKKNYYDYYQEFTMDPNPYYYDKTPHEWRQRYFYSNVSFSREDVERICQIYGIPVFLRPAVDINGKSLSGIAIYWYNPYWDIYRFEDGDNCKKALGVLQEKLEKKQLLRRIANF